MSFTNLYYKRSAATPKACYVCYKPTTTVLSTVNTVDFIYTCPTHLTDPGFASQVGESSDGAEGTRKMGLSKEEIAKVKEEWEQKLVKKKEKEKEKEKDKEKDKETENEKDDGKKANDNGKESKVSKPPGVTTPPARPTHERYALHRDFFAMRLSEHRKRRQTAQAKELAPRLPGAPRGGLHDSVV